MSRKTVLGILAGSALVLAGCATTTFTSIWKAPDAGPLQFQPGDKVVALVVAEQDSIRRSGEANLADVLDRAGLEGVPAYTLVATADARDEARAKRLIEASGAVAAIVLRPLGREKEVSATPTTSYYGSPYYRGFWGGYYGHGWGGAWGGYEVRTDTYVFVETLIYDLRRNELVWAGQTKTMNPRDIEGTVNELAKAVSRELRASGLVAAR
jgi:hypothetical protein